ncbi:hypothetical protein JCGZ_03887 [Jatropha curcas]|uniref:Uncharacterized protein n=1 Tax=Jatropha curcas TaxID=180498 RepID=A0A067JD07_JATCU|nr:hypothetical protein JCGZ_03887 [Jatropha curcas]
MSGPVVRTGCSSGLWRCGLTSNASIRAVRAVTLPLSPGGFLVIWPTVITLTPVARIPSTGGAFLMTGSYLMRTDEVLGKGIRYVGPLEADARKNRPLLTYDF